MYEVRKVYTYTSGDRTDFDSKTFHAAITGLVNAMYLVPVPACTNVV